ncbi:MAG: L-histidine N(alpha)-methyltransferase [Janthinobacterium lividum]
MQDPAHSQPAADTDDLLDGLSRPQKAVAGRHLWDEAGSTLFDRICDSPGYYPTRRETDLLRREAGAIARLVGPGATLVEFGSGASHKIRILLDTLQAPRRYLAIDISGAFLAAACARIDADYPGLEVVPLCADYSRAVRLPERPDNGPVLGFCPGLSMGNLTADAMVECLARARESLSPGWFLLTADGTRDPAELQRAYADPDGLMAAFHLNLLARLSRERDADLDPAAFRHEARVLDHPPRVEAHLVARRAAGFRVSGRDVAFAEGESIHTDTSFKYGPDELAALAARAGWQPVRSWTSASVCLQLLRS